MSQSDRKIDRTTTYREPPMEQVHPDLDLTAPHNAIRYLTDYYQVAVMTGTATGELPYTELATAIHTTMIQIMSGIDPVSAIKDLVDELRADASEMPNEKMASRTRAWAFNLEFRIPA